MENRMSKTHRVNLSPWLQAAAIVLVSACSLIPLRTQPPVAAPPPSAPVITEEMEVRGLLAEVPRLAALGGEEGKQEQQAASIIVTHGTSEMARLRLALLLSLGVGGRNDLRLQALLDEPESRTAATDSPRQQLWNLLQRMNAERIRTHHEAQLRADARVRDAESRVREAQARADDLQKKLDALKSVERTLHKHPVPPKKDTP
jgi:hypothetical protein